MSKNISRSFLAGAALALCLQQTAAVGSEFIEDMPQLTPDPQRVGATIWEKPGVNRADYTRVMIEPITLFISPDSKYKGLSADELKTLSDGFHRSGHQDYGAGFPVVNTAGPGVLYLRAALTNVKVAKKKRGVLGYTPIGFVATSVAHAGIGGISLKDAVTRNRGAGLGQRRAVVRTARQCTEGGGCRSSLGSR